MYKKHRVLAITLARGGSKSIPRKNIAVVSGKPLISYTISEALKSKYIDYYVVSTDDSEIKNVAESLGANCPFLRPSELSSDTATSSAALIHAVNEMESLGQSFDVIVELMVTNPLKLAEDIDACIAELIDNEVDSVVAVHRIYDHHPSRVKFIVDGYLKPFYPEKLESRRQDLSPPAYVRSGSIYAMKSKFLLTNGARYSAEDTRAYILPEERVINIDEPLDLAVFEAMLREG